MKSYFYLILVLVNGSTISLPWASKNIPAIVEAWYPGVYGARAIANALFGANRWGKTPVTIYGEHVLTEFDVESATWATRVVDNTPPLRRACHGAGVVGKHVYVVGGRYWDVAEDDYIFLNDIHILDTRPASTYSSDWRRYLSNESLSDVTLQVLGLRSTTVHEEARRMKIEMPAMLRGPTSPTSEAAMASYSAALFLHDAMQRYRDVPSHIPARRPGGKCHANGPTKSQVRDFIRRAKHAEGFHFGAHVHIDRACIGEARIELVCHEVVVVVDVLDFQQVRHRVKPAAFLRLSELVDDPIACVE